MTNKEYKALVEKAHKNLDTALASMSPIEKANPVDESKRAVRPVVASSVQELIRKTREVCAAIDDVKLKAIGA